MATAHGFSLSLFNDSNVWIQTSCEMQRGDVWFTSVQSREDDSTAFTHRLTTAVGTSLTPPALKLSTALSQFLGSYGLIGRPCS